MLQNLSSAVVVIGTLRVNSFQAGANFCRLLITFANNLEPGQADKMLGLNLDPNCLTF